MNDLTEAQENSSKNRKTCGPINDIRHSLLRRLDEANTFSRRLYFIAPGRLGASNGLTAAILT
jgi:hypothetical protein